MPERTEITELRNIGPEEFCEKIKDLLPRGTVSESEREFKISMLTVASAINLQQELALETLSHLLRFKGVDCVEEMKESCQDMYVLARYLKMCFEVLDND